MIMRALVLLALALATLSARAQPEPEGPEARFSLAGEAMDRAGALWNEDPAAARAALVDALAQYQSLIESGHATPNVHAGAGNAALLLREPGAAVLHYRRALLGAPGHETARAGLEAARALVPVEITPDPRTRAQRGLLWWRGIAPGSTVAVVALLAWAALWTVVALRALGRRSVLRPAPLALVAVLAAGAAAAEHVLVYAPDDAVVMTPAPAHAGPSATLYPATFAEPLPPGVEVTRLETRGPWWRVRLLDGSVTWIPSEHARLIRAP